MCNSKLIGIKPFLYAVSYIYHITDNFTKWIKSFTFMLACITYLHFLFAVAPPQIVSLSPMGEVLPDTRQWIITFDKQVWKWIIIWINRIVLRNVISNVVFFMTPFNFNVFFHQKHFSLGIKCYLMPTSNSFGILVNARVIFWLDELLGNEESAPTKNSQNQNFFWNISRFKDIFYLRSEFGKPF